MFEPADDVFLARLFDLDDDRDYEQDDHQATGDSNNGQVSVIQCFQDTVLPLLWLWKHNRKECLTLSRLTVGQPRQYLCSGSHPRDTHSSGYHCRPKCG